MVLENQTKLADIKKKKKTTEQFDSKLGSGNIIAISRQLSDLLDLRNQVSVQQDI